MSQPTQYGLEPASDAEDNENWFWDTLLDLHDRAKGLIGNPKFFIFVRLILIRLFRRLLLNRERCSPVDSFSGSRRPHLCCLPHRLLLQWHILITEPSYLVDVDWKILRNASRLLILPDVN
jgi:hypothetical protein